MARRKRSSKPTSKRRRSASQIALWVISLIIVVSMVIGFVLSVLPTPADQQTIATPTPVAATATAEPSAAPTSTGEAPVPDGPATPQSDQ